MGTRSCSIFRPSRARTAQRSKRLLAAPLTPLRCVRGSDLITNHVRLLRSAEQGQLR